MKRQRGRGRKPGGGGGGNYHNNNNQGHHHPNRQLETNGPDTKFRGTASYIHERYLAMARDAQSSGDRVLGEAYLQHADHYFRLVRSMQPAMPVQQQQHFNDGADYEGDEEGGSDAEGAEETEARGEGEQQREGEFQQQGERQPREDGGNGEGRRNRGRGRGRFRPDGDREGGNFEARGGDGEQRREGGEGDREPRRERSEGGEQREPREARQPREPREQREPREPRAPRAEGEQREPRRERQPREDRDSASREGFSDGPKPAFLRSGGGGTSGE